MNDRQLRWASGLTALLQATAAARQASATAAAAATAAESEPLAGPTSPLGRPAVAQSSVYGTTTTPAPLKLHPPGSASLPSPQTPASARAAAAARPQTKALGVFGKVWDFLIDEAAYVEGAAEGVARPPSWVGCQSRTPRLCGMCRPKLLEKGARSSPTATLHFLHRFLCCCRRLPDGSPAARQPHGRGHSWHGRHFHGQHSAVGGSSAASHACRASDPRAAGVCCAGCS